ncbi:nitroreductase/quinone reductase family protein [Sphaerisporangium viridialbum]|uniref:nitroreductase/quinone reductase family protein n=1 Tax=Sphaerisporangium viridialbum TaxID=46189 RepID=UPI003C71153C
MSDWNEKIIEEFRANGGKVGGMFEGASLVLITTTGARTGTRRTNPVVYVPDGERILVFASNAGAPAHPAWYHNLLACPEVTVELGDGTRVETFTATAHPLHGEERDRLYARQARLDPAFAAYQEGTTRVIPVVALHRKDAPRARALGDELVRIHAVLRQEMAALLTEVEGFLAGRSGTGMPAPALEAQLSERCLAYCDAVHAHHSNESSRGFPLLEERFPELGPALERLRREHEVVEGIRRDLQRTLTEAGSGDADKVRTDLRRLVSELEAHFDHEERQLVSALNAL